MLKVQDGYLTISTCSKGKTCEIRLENKELDIVVIIEVDPAEMMRGGALACHGSRPCMYWHQSADSEEESGDH